MTDKDKIKEEIESYKESMKGLEPHSDFRRGQITAYNQIIQFVDSLPEEPKFKAGDIVISTNNPSLTYKVLQVGLSNELGKLDYEVEIFTNGKPGIKVGNTFKEHNIHLICCDKMDEWGKLIPEEPVSEDLEEEIENWIKTKHFVFTEIDEVIETAKHFAEWQKQKDQETIELAEDHAMLGGMMKEREEMMKDAVEGTIKYEIGSAETPQCDKHYQILSDQVHIPNAKLGDKVKIIIVKTE